jgi:hypothetical protein
MLERMSSAFEEASRNAPSVMFLDELDSIGTRGNGARDTQNWNVVVNHLLELVQGISHRGNVALIGASNHPSLIEPALLRAGRLGEKIEIPLPTRNGVEEILQDMTGLQDVTEASYRIGSCSPAELKSLVDEANAEKLNTVMTNSDLLYAVDKLTRPNLAPARAKLAMCVRFASMAVSLKRLYQDSVSIHSLSIEPGLRDAGRINLFYRETQSDTAPLVTAGDMLRILNVTMSATAAQTVFSEDMDNSSDMFLGLNVAENEKIKQLALKIVLANGAGNPAFLRPERPQGGSATMEMAVNTVLKHVWTQVLEQVRLDKDKIWNIAKNLHREKTIDGKYLDMCSSKNRNPTITLMN